MQKEKSSDSGTDRCQTPEVWRDIPDYEGFYQASSLGRIRSVPRYVNGPRGKPILLKGRIMKPSAGPNGYLHFGASKHGKTTTTSVHRAVAMAFIDNEEGLPVINHKNGNKLDNYPWNLEWASTSENIDHALDTGLRNDFGERSFHAKLSINDVKEILKLRADGASYSLLAAKFGVSRSNIRFIVAGRSWVRALSADNDNHTSEGQKHA